MGWLILIGFVAVQIGIGVWASRRVRTEADFFVAGRRLGLPLVAMSLFATWFGAETCLGASGAVYAEGLRGGRADPFGYALCLLLAGLLLAGRLARGGYMTLGDLYRQRYGRRAEQLLVWALVPSGLVWGAAQVRAFGQVVTQMTGMDVGWAIVAAATLSVLYTSFGGLLGDVITDLVQGAFVVLGLVTLFVSVVASDLPSHVDVVLSSARMSPFSADESPLVQIDRWAVPVLGSLVAQELVSRMLAARSPEVARRGSLIAALLYLVVGGVPVALGLLGPALVPHLSEPEQILPRLAEKYLARPLYLAFLCALLSAILSTIDSILLSTSALVSHNALEPVFPSRSERTRVVEGRVIVAVSGVLCAAIALSAQGVFALVETASALGTAGVFVTTLAALFLPKPTEAGALGALVLGGIGPPLFERWGWRAPFLSAVSIAALCYGAFWLWQASRSRCWVSGAP